MKLCFSFNISCYRCMSMHRQRHRQELIVSTLSLSDVRTIRIKAVSTHKSNANV